MQISLKISLKVSLKCNEDKLPGLEWGIKVLKSNIKCLALKDKKRNLKLWGFCHFMSFFIEETKFFKKTWPNNRNSLRKTGWNIVKCKIKKHTNVQLNQTIKRLTYNLYHVDKIPKLVPCFSISKSKVKRRFKK